MGVRASDSSGEHRADQVFLHVQIDDLFWAGVQNFFAYMARDQNFGDDVFASAQDPVDGRGLLVRAKIARDRNMFQPRVLLEEPKEERVGRFCRHVVP